MHVYLLDAHAGTQVPSQLPFVRPRSLRRSAQPWRSRRTRRPHQSLQAKGPCCYCRGLKNYRFYGTVYLMCVYIYVYIYLYMYNYIYIYTHLCIHICLMYTHNTYIICMYLQITTCMYIYIYIFCVCIYNVCQIIHRTCFKMMLAII